MPVDIIMGNPEDAWDSSRTLSVIEADAIFRTGGS